MIRAGAQKFHDPHGLKYLVTAGNISGHAFAERHIRYISAFANVVVLPKRGQKVLYGMSTIFSSLEKAAHVVYHVPLCRKTSPARRWAVPVMFLTCAERQRILSGRLQDTAASEFIFLTVAVRHAAEHLLKAACHQVGPRN